MIRVTKGSRKRDIGEELLEIHTQAGWTVTDGVNNKKTSVKVKKEVKVLEQEPDQFDDAEDEQQEHTGDNT